MNTAFCTVEPFPATVVTLQGGRGAKLGEVDGEAGVGEGEAGEGAAPTLGLAEGVGLAGRAHVTRKILLPPDTAMLPLGPTATPMVEPPGMSTAVDTVAVARSTLRSRPLSATYSAISTCDSARPLGAVKVAALPTPLAKPAVPLGLPASSDTTPPVEKTKRLLCCSVAYTVVPSADSAQPKDAEIMAIARGWGRAARPHVLFPSAMATAPV